MQTLSEVEKSNKKARLLLTGKVLLGLLPIRALRSASYIHVQLRCVGGGIFRCGVGDDHLDLWRNK